VTTDKAYRGSKSTQVREAQVPPEGQSDFELIDRFLVGEVSASDALVQKYQQDVYRKESKALRELPPEEQRTQLRERWQEWQQLPPEQRQRLKQRYEEFQCLPLEEHQRLREELQRSPPEERKRRRKR
jgi:Protein of unknown function (DUF3106)